MEPEAEKAVVARLADAVRASTSNIAASLGGVVAWCGVIAKVLNALEDRFPWLAPTRTSEAMRVSVPPEPQRIITPPPVTQSAPAPLGP